MNHGVMRNVAPLGYYVGLILCMMFFIHVVGDLIFYSFLYRMGKAKVVDKDSKMCVQTKEKDGDGRIVKKFRAASNFVYKPLHQVMGAKDGYIMKVTTYPHNAQM